MTGRGVGACALRAFLWGAAIACLAAATLPAGPAGAAPKPKREGIPKMTLVPRPAGVVDDSTADDSDFQSTPRTYGAMVRRFGVMSPSDSVGNGEFRAAEAAFAAGRLDEAMKAYGEFTRRYPRNLSVNDALSTVLLIKNARDFDDRPLLLYARARAKRSANDPDSAAILLQQAVEKYPGAAVRHHAYFMLAELAQARLDHANALRWALAAADTSRANRLAPLALQIAAESSLALGEPPQKALAYYKTILERYPQSVVTPEARLRALEIRKRMPQ